MNLASRLFAFVGLAAFSFFVAMPAQAAYSDPPGRVARVSDSRGEISYSPAGENDWLYLVRNRPLVGGDRLWSSRRARAELQVGSAAIRMSENTGVELLELSDEIVQLRLTQGSLNVRIRRFFRGQTLEIATPSMAFVIDSPGNYRIDVDPRRDLTTVVVWNGDAEVYGQNANFPLITGDVVRFYSDDLRDYDIFALPAMDGFDRYARSRDYRLERSASLRYVSDDLIGYADLDQYGSWSANRDYGNVWFPTQVRSDWAPYRDGHWVWQEPWGWTWVDDAPWGFAPSHYGRWVSVSNRWGWIPGPRNNRSIYSPALVAFVGGRAWNASISLGGGARTGWFPLGPRDAYLPSYPVSREYFTQVNASNTGINNAVISNVYKSFSSGRMNIAQSTFSNRGVPGALTVVANDVFVNAKSVREAQVQIDVNASRGGEILQLAPIAPSAKSVIGLARKATNEPDQAMFSREVIVRNNPDANAAPFSERMKQLQRNPGKVGVPAAKEKRSDSADNDFRVISPSTSAINVRELGSRREGEKKSDAAGAPVQLQMLDRSVNAEAALIPEAAGRQRDEQTRQQQNQRKEEERKQETNAQTQRDAQTRKQENDRKEVERQQAANAQTQRDEQTRKQETDRKEVERQQAANAQTQRDEQTRKQESDRKEVERQQAVNAQAQRDEQTRKQETDRKEVERQQAANAQAQRDEQTRKEENDRKEVERQQAANAQAQRDEQTRKEENDRKEVERQQGDNAQAQRDEQVRQQQQQQQTPQDAAVAEDDGKTDKTDKQNSRKNMDKKDDEDGKG